MSDHFEEAVGRMLEDVADVDRSLIVEARATIAALPDRHAGALRRVRTSFSRRLPSWERYAAAGLAVALAIVLMAGLLGRSFGPIASTSPSPAPTQPPATASPSATFSANLRPSASSLRSGPAYPETLPVLFTASHLAVVGWSPDGSRYAVTCDVPNGVEIRLFDRSGSQVGSVPGVGLYQFGWLSSDRYVVIGQEDRVNRTGEYHAFIGQVGSTQLTDLGHYDVLIPGPSGAVTLEATPNGDVTVNTNQQYVVLSADGSVSKLRDGSPLAWSRDGKLLAVYHPRALAPVPSGEAPVTVGSLEVVRSTGESVATTRGLSFAFPYGVAFSPDGTHVAFGLQTQPPSNPDQIAVMDVRTGDVSTVPQFGSMTWASNDQLLYAYASTDYGKTPAGIMSWSASTGRTTMYAAGDDTVGASGLGTVITGNDTTHRFTWNDSTPGHASSGSFSVGDAIGWGSIPDSAWSPDGTSLILTVGDWNQGKPMDALLFQAH